MTMEEIYKAEVECLRKTLREIVDENVKLRRKLYELEWKILHTEGENTDGNNNIPEIEETAGK